ncbi:MAG: serine/threonine protein kinase, partial [Prevotellaceae bacterium]|nr:serine/threonine protein kinase [Prevotellaceae bacterium]
MNNASTSLRPGTLLEGGKYRIVRFISSGGFGCTYEAEHTQMQSRIAIKEFFISDFCNRDERTGAVSLATQSKRELVEKLRKKFVEEARSVFRMQHDHIVRVMDVFEANGTAYYAMDYIEGQSLADLVKRRGPLPEAEAVGYIRQVADALAYVHSLNRLHLDVKPGNIMVNKRGKAILIDFGASKQYDEVDGENTSTLMGRTPGFAPPEQMDNSVGHFYPSTD